MTTASAAGSGPGGDGLGAVVARALAEDLDARGDLTSAATVPADAVASAAVVAREAGVVAGIDTVRAVAGAVDGALRVRPLVADGDRVAADSALVLLEGPARALLAAERTALNFLGHLCGVATATAAYVDAVAGTGCAVRDTRKTLPGLRDLEKAAVLAGGGTNHRRGLSDGILVKDNHVAAAGGVAAATVAAVAAGSVHDVSVEIEVDDLAELDEALAAGARAVLLDNFPLADLRRAVARCREHAGSVFVEASGGITLETVGDVARTGVDAVAVGALTHSVRALDVALDFGRTDGEG